MNVCLSVRPSVCHTCAAVRVRGADERQQTKYLLPVTRTLYSVPVRFSLQIQKICPVEGGGWRVECCDKDVTQNVGVDVRCDAMSARH